MSVIAVIPAREWHDEVADSRSHWEGSYAPYGYAGFLCDTCTILCPACAEKESEKELHPIFGDTETDFPGMYCMECDTLLDVDMLIYESGPGSELVGPDGDLPDAAFEV